MGSEFEIGDIVQHKIGGPKTMMVTQERTFSKNLEQWLVACRYWSNGEFKEELFGVFELEKLDVTTQAANEGITVGGIGG